MNNILKDDDIPFLQNILWIIFCHKTTLYKGIHAPYWPSAIRIQPVPSYTDFVQPNKYQSLMYYTDSVHSFITSQRTTQSTGSSYINIQDTKLLPPFYHLTVKYWSHSCKLYFQFCAKKLTINDFQSCADKTSQSASVIIFGWAGQTQRCNKGAQLHHLRKSHS